MTIKDGLLTKKQAAELIGVHRETFRSWAMSKDGPPYVRIGKRALYPQSQLMDWIETHRHRYASGFDVFSFLSASFFAYPTRPCVASRPTLPGQPR